uniref:transposase n=1 Tax=Leptospira borgpetersenii TaxID=174 RepID=UPI00358DD119
MSIPEVCRKYGISGNTFYRWRTKYGEMELSDLKRMKTLEEKNGKLKKLYAGLTWKTKRSRCYLKKSGKPGAETESDSAHQTKTWRTEILSHPECISNRLSKQIRIL